MGETNHSVATFTDSTFCLFLGERERERKVCEDANDYRERERDISLIRHRQVRQVPAFISVRWWHVSERSDNMSGGQHKFFFAGKFGEYQDASLHTIHSLSVTWHNGSR